MHGFLPQTVAMVAASALIAYICHRLKILPIVGFLLAGVLIGPHALGLVQDAELIDQVAEIGIVLLLFTLGIEFSLERLWRIKRAIFIGGGLQLLLTIAAVAGLLMLMHVDWRVGVYTGALVALSSTALVLKVLGDQNEITTPKGQLALGILIFQDLAIVGLVLIVPMLAGGAGSTLGIVKGLGTAAVIVVLVVIVARRVMPPVLERVARTCSPEIFLLTIIAICLGTAWLTSLAGVSLSLGAFLAGLVMSESRFSHHAFAEILPLQILFSAVFFISVGMLLDVRFVASQPLLILGVVIAVVIVKVLVTGVAAKLLNYPGPIIAASAFLLAQIGEFSFVLERVGRAAGLFPAGVSDGGGQIFIAATVLLMALTPLLAKAGRAVEEHKSARTIAAATRAAEPQIEQVTLENHVIVAGYGSAARYLTRVLRDSGVPFIIVTLSPTGATEAQVEGLRVMLGDYSKRFLLVAAAIENAKMLVIPDDTADMARRVIAVARGINPTLHVVVRTQAESEVDPLIAEGADDVLVDEIEIGVQLFTHVLDAYQVTPGEIDAHVETVRSGGYAALRAGIPEVPLVVCEDLGEACFDTRTFTVRRGTATTQITIGDLATRANVRVVSVQRGSEVIAPPPAEFVLQSGDRLTARASAQSFAAAARLLSNAATSASPSTEEPPIRSITLTPEQRAACEHARSVRAEITSTATGCEECVQRGETWVHLRACMTCGRVRCCDSSPNQHATKHFHTSGHPVMRSYEPTELWGWCYPEEKTL
ncbi:MAG TPA: cation:proton antiporter [Thermoanaerobaculia bacterium]|jgi:CPA2 family monovalent cation:H+ antiporter-2|nr:cation:proton antiporter [Thermoanaerobaculia bacterium]